MFDVDGWKPSNFWPGQTMCVSRYTGKIRFGTYFVSSHYEIISDKEGSWRSVPSLECTIFESTGLGYCFTPYQRLWLYNGAPLVAFYDTLGIRRTYSRLKPPASSRGLESTGTWVTWSTTIANPVGCWLVVFEDLRRFSNISVISRLGSRR